MSTPTGADYGGSVSGTSGEQGAFMIHGNVITWLPAGGGSYANTVGFKPGGLYLDGKLWLHCM